MKYKCKNYNNCGNKIVFTERDVEFFVAQSWVDDEGNPIKPKYCKPCRLEKKKKYNKHGLQKPHR